MTVKTERDPHEMLGPTELAAAAGLAVTTIHQYRSQGKLPPPDGEPSGHPVWFWKTAEPWLAARETDA